MPDIDPEAWYVYDHVDAVVIRADLDEEDAAELAREHSERCMAITGSALQEFDEVTTISWETNGVRKVTDGGQPAGAIDNEFDAAERSPAETLLDALDDIGAPTHGSLTAGDVALDLVTRQPLLVRRRVADDLAEYYEREEFDLLTYKQHAFLPVGIDDPVFECVFIADIGDLHTEGRSYDYPAGRLARVPVELAGGDA